MWVLFADFSSAMTLLLRSNFRSASRVSFPSTPFTSNSATSRFLLSPDFAFGFLLGGGGGGRFSDASTCVAATAVAVVCDGNVVVVVVAGQCFAMSAKKLAIPSFGGGGGDKLASEVASGIPVAVSATVRSGSLPVRPSISALTTTTTQSKHNTESVTHHRTPITETMSIADNSRPLSTVLTINRENVSDAFLNALQACANAMVWRKRHPMKTAIVVDACVNFKTHAFLVLPTHVDGSEDIRCDSNESMTVSAKRFPNAKTLRMCSNWCTLLPMLSQVSHFKRLLSLSVNVRAHDTTTTIDQTQLDDAPAPPPEIPQSVVYLKIISNVELKLPHMFMESLFRRGIHLAQTVCATSIRWLTEGNTASLRDAFASVTLVHNTHGIAGLLKRAMETRATTSIQTIHVTTAATTSVPPLGWHVWKGLYHHKILSSNNPTSLRLERDLDTSRAMLASRGFYAISPSRLRSVGLCATKHSFMDTLLKECVHHFCNGDVNEHLETCKVVCHDEEFVPLLVGCLLRYINRTKRNDASVALVLQVPGHVRKAVIDRTERLVSFFGMTTMSDVERVSHHNTHVAAMSRMAKRKTHGIISDVTLRDYTSLLASIIVPSETDLMPMAIFKCKYAADSYVWTSELNSLFNINCPAQHIKLVSSFTRDGSGVSAKCTFASVKNKTVLNISIE